jgi:hypothetical protein
MKTLNADQNNVVDVIVGFLIIGGLISLVWYARKVIAVLLGVIIFFSLLAAIVLNLK